MTYFQERVYAEKAGASLKEDFVSLKEMKV